MSLDPTEPPGEDQLEPAPSTTGPEQPGPYYEFAPSDNSYPPNGYPPDSYPSGNSYPPPPENPYQYTGNPQNYFPAAPAPQYGNPLPPLPLGDAVAELPLQYWKILRQPGARAFAEEVGRAKWNIVLVQLIVYTLLDGLLGWLHNVLYPIPASSLATASSTTNGLSAAQLQSLELTIINFTSGPGLLLLVPLGFFLYQSIGFGIARAFGGRGSFLTQSYASLLVYVPVGVINIALSYVPLDILPDLISFALSIYAIVLSVFAMMGAHRLTGGKASAAALLPFVGLFLLSCCAVFIVLLVLVGNAVPQ